MKTLDAKVRFCLEKYPDTRNSDITLTIEIWKNFYAESVITARNGKLGLYIDDLFKLPREDNVKRIRAKIQNVEKKFLPTNPEVAKKRGWKINEWREYLGYSPLKGEDNE